MTYQHRADVHVHSPDPGATFQCPLDGAARRRDLRVHDAGTPRPRPQASHTFPVRAVTRRQPGRPPRRGPSPSTRPRPNTTITAGPTGSLGNDTTPRSRSSPRETGLDVPVPLDGAAFGACLASYTGLSQGSHTFAVRATDAAGNTDGTPASRTCTVDTSRAGAVDRAPARVRPGHDIHVDARRTARPSATFQCRLDGRGVRAVPVAAHRHPAATPAAPAHVGAARGMPRDTAARPRRGRQPHRRHRRAGARPSSRACSPTWLIDGGPIGLTARAARSRSTRPTRSATFECRLDGPGRTDTVQRVHLAAGYGGLQDGAHTFAASAQRHGRQRRRAGSDPAFTLDTRKPDRRRHRAVRRSPVTTAVALPGHGASRRDDRLFEGAETRRRRRLRARRSWARSS